MKGATASDQRNGPGSTRAGSIEGTLFVVATPIGNLEDITLRALRVLREVSTVAAEDTRRTGNLLRHYDIGTPLVSLHAHNERRREAELLQKLRAGESIALVSDAGTPGISDPGARLVRAARDAGLRVEPVPGASAVTTVLSASGLSLDRFAYGGFPPTRSKARILWFEWLATMADTPVVFFEAPHRVHRTLQDLAKFSGNRPIVIARELTKLHEQWIFGTAADLVSALPVPKGEFVLIAVAERPTVRAPPPSVAEIVKIFGQLTENGLTRRDAVRATAKRLHTPVNIVYRVLESAKKSGERPK